MSIVLSAAGFIADDCVSSPQLFMVSSSSNFGLYTSDFEFGFAFGFILIFLWMSEMYLCGKKFNEVNVRAHTSASSTKTFIFQSIFQQSRKKFTQSLNRVQNVPNRLDNVDVVAVYYGCIQRDDLLAVTKV